MNDQPLGRALIALARRAIGQGLNGQSGVAKFFLQVPPDSIEPKQTANADFSKQLEELGASFVTLTRDGALRGCIGTLEAYRPLGIDVCENARAAAFRDPRFPSVTTSEWPSIQVEVSVLSPPTELVVSNQKALEKALVPETDGVILAYGQQRATFLPQVWEQLPEPADFLRELKRKAGLPADFWSPDLKVQRYQVKKWRQ